MDLIKMAMTELKLSARAYDRILKVSRTIVDLENAPAITTEHSTASSGAKTPP